MTTIRNNLQRVRERIATACAARNARERSHAARGVQDLRPRGGARGAFAAGQTAFGENYIQEAVEKMALLPDLPLQWHCIGPIQSNKTRLVAANFHWAHTVDRLKIAQRLSEQRPAGMAPLQVCIQVNIDGGATKAGVAPDEALALAREVAALPRHHAARADDDSRAGARISPRRRPFICGPRRCSTSCARPGWRWTPCRWA